jgi:pilus assembly protein Flp/PilA
MGLRQQVARLPKGCAVHEQALAVTRIRLLGKRDRPGTHAGPEHREKKGTDLMRSLLGTVERFLRSEDGPTAVEYAVMLALIIVVCIAAITTLGQNANKTFGNVALNGTLTSSS